MSSDTHKTRKLTADELYPHLYKSYKMAQQRIGEMQSYIDELKYENQKLTTELNTIKNESEKD